MAEPSPVAAEGLLASLKTLAASLAGIVQTRLELLATDVAEARERAIALLVLVLVALFALGVGVVLLAILIAAAYWETHRLAVLGVLAAVFLCGGAGAAWLAVRKLRDEPRPFAASLAELDKDREQLRLGP
jgi:uncharacterized membrane protein YqjE